MDIDINAIDIAWVMGSLVKRGTVTPSQKRTILAKMAGHMNLKTDHTSPDNIIHVTGEDEDILKFVQLIHPATRGCYLQFVNHRQLVPMLIQAVQQDHLAAEDYEFMLFGNRTVLALRRASDAVWLKLSVE